MGWLNDRQGLGIAPGLDRMEALLDLLGSPHDHYRTIHVAGTNGKGSVAAILASAIQLSGHHTGLYTSPHVVEFNERIRVDGEAISPEDLATLLAGLRGKVETLDADDVQPTFFEITTAASLTHFSEEEVDWAVVEAGMGGRGDATNVIRPELAIITNVSLEHTEFLGHDHTSIAREKAGIIDPGTPVVTAADGEALEVIRREAADRGSQLTVIGEDYTYQFADRELVVQGPNGPFRSRLGMAGSYQHENATVAVAACDVLRSRGLDVSEQALQQALARTSLRGRMETFDDEGTRVTIDGAHNPAAARRLSESVTETGRVFDLIVGFSADKDWPKILNHLTPLTRRVWGVPIRSTRSLDPAKMIEYIPANVEFTVSSCFEEAYRRARATGAREVLVTGSLFLAGEARAVMTGHDLSEIGGSQ